MKAALTVSPHSPGRCAGGITERIPLRLAPGEKRPDTSPGPRDIEVATASLASIVIPTPLHGEAFIDGGVGNPLPVWIRFPVWSNQPFKFFAKGDLPDVLRTSAIGSQMRLGRFFNHLAKALIHSVDADPRWHDCTSFDRDFAAGRRAARGALATVLQHLDTATASSPQ